MVGDGTIGYNEQLAEWVADLLLDQPALTERKMFGGISFLLHGNLCCGVVNEELVVRVGPDAYEESLAAPHAREMDFTGWPMKGWVFVASAGVDMDEALEDWVAQGVRFALTLPPK